MNASTGNPENAGFTLMELVVVMGVISVLMGIGIGYLSRSENNLAIARGTLRQRPSWKKPPNATALTRFSPADLSHNVGQARLGPVITLLVGDVRSADTTCPGENLSAELLSTCCSGGTAP